MIVDHALLNEMLHAAMSSYGPECFVVGEDVLHRLASTLEDYLVERSGRARIDPHGGMTIMGIPIARAKNASPTLIELHERLSGMPNIQVIRT